jgi:hypothetical protein
MGESPGEESRPAAIAAQAIEAQPTSGQIKPSRGRAGRALKSIHGEGLAHTFVLKVGKVLQGKVGLPRNSQ